MCYPQELIFLKHFVTQFNRSNQTYLRGRMKSRHLLINKECVRNPNLFDVVCSHDQLVNIRLK